MCIKTCCIDLHNANVVTCNVKMYHRVTFRDSSLFTNTNISQVYVPRFLLPIQSVVNRNYKRNAAANVLHFIRFVSGYTVSQPFYFNQLNINRLSLEYYVKLLQSILISFHFTSLKTNYKRSK